MVAPRMTLTHLSDRAFTIDGLLLPEDCNALIALSEAQGFAAASVRTAQGQQAMPLLRSNERVVVEAPAWRKLVWQRLSAHPLPNLQGQRATGLPRALRFYKYTEGQRFKMHKDGPWAEDGLTSQLTLLVYLNEGFQGGNTTFRDLTVTPRTGTALIFLHDTWHEGSAVASGTKYVLRSDVMYDRGT
jgi:predicted 2-oxoglutarate/Fe(II)-dependent dioxygenase YbiX